MDLEPVESWTMFDGHLLKEGDIVTFSGLPVTYRKWWQFWKPRVIYDPNGTFRLTHRVRSR